jgi:hypothetical protein
MSREDGLLARLRAVQTVCKADAIEREVHRAPARCNACKRVLAQLNCGSTAGAVL